MIFGIDLGSNTLRGVLMNKNGKIVKSAEFIVGSARNLQSGGDLDPDAITRIKSALKKWIKFLILNRAKIPSAWQQKPFVWQKIRLNFLMKFGVNSA